MGGIGFTILVHLNLALADSTLLAQAKLGIPRRLPGGWKLLAIFW